MEQQYYIYIMSYETGLAVKTMGPTYLRDAEKIDRGANINLNHEEYYTLIIEKEE